MTHSCTAISDTHGRHSELTLQPCDFLFHCGDWTNNGEIWEMAKFTEWFVQQPATHKVIIAGNHERAAQSSPWFVKDMFKDRGIHYLCNSEITLDGIKIWGSPFTPEFKNWAFNMKREDLHLIWEDIPVGLHVLMTHGPPFGILDESLYDGKCRRQGCQALLDAVKLKVPKYHLFGHIHGKHNHFPTFLPGTQFINAANSPRGMGPLLDPITFEITV